MIELRLGCARAVYTDRHGGVSAPPYDSMNLAGHVGDDPAAVARNALRLAVGARAGRSRRVGATVPRARDRRAGGRGRAASRVEGDGAATTVPGLPLLALGADCAPIALANDYRGRGDPCGLARRPRRGRRSRRRRDPLARVRAGARGDRPVHLRAATTSSVPTRSPHSSRASATRCGGRRPTVALRSTFPPRSSRALEDAGVDEITDTRCCTFESADHYSYRRDGRTGRQAVVVVKQP